MNQKHFDFVRHSHAAVSLPAIGLAMIASSVFLSHPETSVFHKIVEIGSWLRGDGAKPDVVTWPAWGYAWVIAWMRHFEWIVVFQACLGTIVLVAFGERLRRFMPKQGLIVAVLCVLAIPWHDMQLTLYPSGLAGSLVLLALLTLATAVKRNELRIAIAAGILMGLAQNFRTEFVLLPVLVGICTHVLGHRRVVNIVSMKPIWTFVLVALLLQLPWAFFYHSESGRYSLTESNFGHVMYVSLGSDPNNPWKIEGNDHGAMQAVRDEGYSFSSLSEPGNRVLRLLVWAKVKQHPGGLVRRTVQQLRNTMLAPFNWGEPKLDISRSRDLDVLRQELKARWGVGINVSKLTDYRDQGLYSRAKDDRAAVLALFYQVGAVGIGALVFILGILGMAWSLLRAGGPRAELLLWLLASAALYKVIQDVLLAYQVNYLNNVYPMFLPFVAVSLTAIRDGIRGMLSGSAGWVSR